MVVDMEATKYHSPHLKTVLKRYQMYAGNTLCGPSAVLSRLENQGGGSNGGSSSSSSSNSPAGASTHEMPDRHMGTAKMENIKEESEMKTSLLHQQLQSSAGATADRIKREIMGSTNKSFEQMMIQQPALHPRSSFVPVRRVSDNVLEIHRHADNSQIRSNAVISRSKSNPAGGPHEEFKLPLYGKSSSSSSSSSSASSTTSSNSGRDTPVNLSPVATSALRSPVISASMRPSHISHHHGGHRPTIGDMYSPPVVLFPGKPSHLLPPPIFSTSDRSWAEKEETLLEGERISCFVVGGEKRLCFPQILTSVLRGFQLHQINQVCDELQIFCSRCSSEQLEVLKACGIIPTTASSCGLITKTDAERLVNSLLHRNPPKAAISTFLSAKDSKSHFRVYHKCFGKCKGIVNLHLYDNPEALCIECADCHGLFSPARFVAHSHRPVENRTCHWGFDTANWRHYLLVPKDQEDSEKLEEVLKEFKSKFDHKRKEIRSSSGETDDPDDLDGIKAKKSRLISAPEILSSLPLSTTVRSLTIPTHPAGFSKLPPTVGPFSPVDHTAGVSQLEIDRVKKMLTYRLEESDSAEAVQLLDKLTKKISSLEQICRSQAKFIQEVSQEMVGSENQQQTTTNNPSTTTNTEKSAPTTPTTPPVVGEAELHSLKKHLLRRHNECGKV